MESPTEPDPVKLFVAVLWSDQKALSEGVERMRQLWGTVDFEGPDSPFDVTDFYEPEMGAGE